MYVRGSSKLNGCKLVTYHRLRLDSQKFFFNERNGTIKNANSGKCLGAPNAASFVQLRQYDCNNFTDKIFEIKKINWSFKIQI